MESSPQIAMEEELSRHVAKLDQKNLCTTFQATDEFVRIPNFLPSSITNQLLEILPNISSYTHRSYIPNHKSGGSVSCFNLAKYAPVFTNVYHSKAILKVLSEITQQTLLFCPANDPHAYALYLYSEKGDHIGFHYDKSYYSGSRYTALIGLTDNSSCKLECELYTRKSDIDTITRSIKLMPGELVFFNGDKVRHKVTPSQANEARIALTMEYVTNTEMTSYQRFASSMKDAVAYFGFGELFRTLFKRER